MRKFLLRPPQWLPWLSAICVWLLALLPLQSMAQVYYTLNDGGAATTTDQLRSVTTAGTGDVLIKDNFVQGAGPAILDAANNRLLVADTRVSQPSTSTTNTKIVAVSLAAGNAVTTLITPTYIAGSTSTVVAGLDIDRVNNYLYYTLNDGSATTTTDQLRRVNLDGSNDVLIKDNFVQGAGPLVLDAANNRVLVADTRVSQPSTSTTNTKIVAVSLAAGNAVTTLITPTYIAGSTSTVVGDLAIDRTNNYLYYTLNDGGATTTTDQLRRVNLDGSNDVLIKDNFVQVAGPLVLDAANNRVLVADTRVSQPSTSTTNTKIVAVSLAAGNAVTTLITPTYIGGSTSTAVAGLAVLEAVAPTVTTTAPTTITTSSAVLGGNITADGGTAVTARGVVYSTTNATPTIGGSGVTQASNNATTSTFSASISSLTPGTRYYVAAYATNSAGTGYGNVLQFVTPPSAPTVTAPANGSATNDNTPAYTGTSQANATVTVYVDGSSIGTTTANASGNWAFTQPTALAQGSHTVYATATVTVGGNTSAASANSSTNTFIVDTTAPTVTISSSAGSNGSTTTTTPIPFTVTFSESVTGFTSSASDLVVAGGTVSGFSGSGSTYTFSVTPTGSGTTVTVNVPASAATDAAGNGNTAASQFSITYQQPTTTVASVTGLTPTPTATAQVNYRVTFAASVSGITTSNFSLTTTGISGASITSVSGSGTTYTVVVNTGSGDGTLRLNVASSTGITPSVTNVPYTAGDVYTITKSFAAAPTLRIQAAGSASGNSDVTAFVDVVQVLQSGTSTVVANGLQNGSFETNNVPAGGYLYQQTGVVASPWTFTTQAGVSRNSSAFGSTAADGDAVAILQSALGNNGNVSQNLAVPTGSYQVSFRAIQRNYTSLDQRLNVFVNDVFVGNIQPNFIPTYDTFTSASFNVFAPALTATVSTTSASPTSTAPIPFAVSFSQSVGTTFTAADVTVTGGTLTGGSFSGSGSGPYTFTVTPSGTGTVTVSLAANVASDANNTQNSASNAVSVQYNQPVTAAPVVTTPANGSQTNNTTPTYTGTAVPGSTVTVSVDGSSIGTTTADGSGNWSLTQPSALSQGSHTVRATAQTSGSSVSANSNTNTFTVDTTRPSVAITSSTAANGGSTSASPIVYTVTFSENVNASFVAGDVSVTNGTISGFATVVAGTTFTFNVTPAANGVVTVTVPANVAQDAAANFNTAGTPSPYSITYTQPVVATAQNVTVQLNANGTATLNASSVNNGSTGGGTLTYTIQKIVYGRVAEGSTLTLTTPSGANFTGIRFASYGTPIDNGNGNYTLGNCNASNSTAVVGGILLGNSSGSIAANNGTFGDPCFGTTKALAVQAGYSANATSLTYNCTEANKTQFVLLTVTDGSGNTSTSVAQVTVNPAPAASFTLSPASGNVGDVITASGSNLSGATALTVNGATATISNLTATGFTFVVPAGATAGPGSVVLSTPCSQTPSTAFTVTQLATAAPVVVSPANGSLTNNPTPPFTGTAVPGSTVTVSVDGSSIGTTTADASGNWSLTPTAALASGSHTVYATAQASGNSVSGNSNTNTFTVDTVQPSVAISSTAGASGSTTGTSPIPFTVTFSESVTGFTTGDLTVTNGTVSGFSGSGTTYTFSVTPTAPGTATTVYVPASVAQDAAGNGNTAAASAYSLTFTAPTIVVTPSALPNGTQGTAYSVTFSATGGTAPYTFAITAGAVPAGLSLASNGTLAGTPTANGTFNFTVTATDNSAAPGPYSGSRAYSLTINAPTSTVWTGNTDTNWFTASNWSTGVVPTSTTDATIPSAPSGGRFPALTAGAANTRNLTLNSGSTLTMSGGTLAIAANLTNNGTFTAIGGTVGLGATIASNILGSGNTSFWNLTVGSNGVQQSTSATTSVQRLLTLNGNYTTNGNPFTLLSSANLTAMVINNGSSVVNGTATVQRYIVPDLNPNLGYRHVSAPITNATIGSLAIAGGYSPVVNSAYNTSLTPTAETPFPTVYGYDQSRIATANNNLADFDKGWFSPDATTDAMTPGKGYTVLAAANQTWNFTGTLGNGNLTQTLARNSGATAANSGLHLVGNPYPSPLDLSQITASDRVNLDQFVAVWTSNDPTNPYAGAYAYYNNGLGTAGPVVPLGQAFFTRVTPGQTSGTLTFRNSQRLTSYQNPTYHRTTETRPVVQLSLQAVGSSTVDNAFVYFEQGATAAFDSPFDAPKMANPSGLNLSSSFAGSERLAINGLEPLTTTQRIVPLQVGVPTAGSYTLNAAQVLNLATTPVYLRDKQTGAVVDLAQQPSYSFVVSNASALLTSRFELVFSPQSPLATAPAALAAQVGVYPNPATTTAYVELPAALGRVAVAAELVDALGRTVRAQSLPAQGAAAHRLDLANLATGVYTLHLNTSAGVIVKKLVVQ